MKQSLTTRVLFESACACLSSLILLLAPDKEVKPSTGSEGSPILQALLLSPGLFVHKTVQLQPPKDRTHFAVSLAPTQLPVWETCIVWGQERLVL